MDEFITLDEPFLIWIAPLLSTEIFLGLNFRADGFGESRAFYFRDPGGIILEMMQPVLGMDKSYDRMFRHVFTPILDRYGVLQQDRPYIMVFYIRGLMAIISEWLKNDCAEQPMGKSRTMFWSIMA